MEIVKVDRKGSLYVEAPERVKLHVGVRAIFLAGGIMNVPNWQQEMADLLQETGLVLFNPKRAVFPFHDPTAAPEQIEWEHDYLRMADAILFWFPCETLCPIVLYELGAWSMTSKTIFVGVHPDYKRRRDVEVQTGLTRPDVVIVYSIEKLAEQIKSWNRRGG